MFLEIDYILLFNLSEVSCYPVPVVFFTNDDINFIEETVELVLWRVKRGITLEKLFDVNMNRSQWNGLIQMATMRLRR